MKYTLKSLIENSPIRTHYRSMMGFDTTKWCDHCSAITGSFNLSDQPLLFNGLFSL